MELLLKTEIPGATLFAIGKVRDTFDLGDLLLMVATDRISAFDVVLPNGVPDKGLVLNQLSGFWFDKTRHIVPNHLRQMVDSVEVIKSYFPRVRDADLSVLVGRSMIVKKAKPLYVECVVRGYLAGSAWREYQKNQSVCGISLPYGLREAEQLTQPIFTPATKARSGHDENITFDQMVKMVGGDVAEQLRDISLRLYKEANLFANIRGIIIADTKFEFGTCDGQIILIDELLTPDSSRFWDFASYRPGKSQPSFDKQPVRHWLTASGWNKRPPAPPLPDEVVKKTTTRYTDAFERLVGKRLPQKFV